MPAGAQSLDELYQKAKPEGAFTLYVGGPSAPWEARARTFEERYPGIKISITGGFSNVLDKKVDQQLSAGKLEVDAAIFQTLNDFVRWKAQGHLLAYKPPSFETIDVSFKDSDGAFYGVQVIAMPYMFNTQHVKDGDVPNSANDFLKPIFNGKNVTPYPADDDATLWLFTKVVKKYGWDWMDKYMATKPNFIQGHLPVARSVASGENIATFDASSSVWPFKREGKLEIVWSPVDETPVFTLTGGIFKDAPHPNAAKLYLTWFLAREQQSRLGSFSSRVDVPPPEGFQPLASYKIANNYREFMTNDKLVADLRNRFEGHTATP